MGAILVLAGIVGAVFFSFRAQGTMSGRADSRNRLAAQAAFGRVVRESPDAPDAKLSEAEYVQKHAKRAPSAIGSWLLAMISLFLLMPFGCFVMVAS